MEASPMVRRLIPSLMVGAVCALVLGGVATATDDATGADASGNLPDTFGVAAPRLGDAWSYNVTLSGAWTFGLEDEVGLDRSHDFGDFEWVASDPVRGGDGFVHDANQLVAHHLYYSPYAYEELPSTANASSAIRAVNPFWGTGTRIAWFQAGGNEVVQDGFSHSDNFTHTEYGIAAGIGASVEQHSFLFEHIVFPKGESHCLASNALQGTNGSLPKALQVLGRCELGGEFLVIPDGVLFAPMRTQTVNGVDTVLFEGRQNGTFQAWFNPDIPYPVRLAFELPSQSDRNDEYGYGQFPGARSAVLDLVGYSPGSAALDTTDDAGKAGAAPPLEYAERQPWGMDDSGVDHPFPLSEAYLAAMADQVFADLRTYVKAHPDAYVAAAEYREQHGQFSLERRWGIGLTDGGDEPFEFSAIQTTYSPLLPVAARDAAPETVSFQQGGGPWFDWRDAPPMDELPAEFPTVESLAARWAAFDGSGLGLNAWGFAVGCMYGVEICERDEIMFLGGHSRDDWSSFDPQFSVPTDPYGTSSSAYIERKVVFGSDGRALFMDNEDDRTTTTDIDSGPLPSTPPGGSSPGLSRTASDIHVAAGRTWMPPPQEAAGIGLFAIAAGGLYWIFPKLKALALLGLFSRVHGDQLLEHPARQNLLNLIEAQPGIHLNELGRKSNLPNGTLTHHLEKLRGAGIVIARPMGGYTCYFARGTRADPGAAALKSPGARQVLDALRKQPGLSNLELANATGLQPSTVNYHVQKLSAAGLVGSMRAGRSVRLHALAA